jgi:hypothetical protein
MELGGRGSLRVAECIRAATKTTTARLIKPEHSHGPGDRKTRETSLSAGPSPALCDVVRDAGVLLRPRVQTHQTCPARRRFARSRVLHHHIRGTARQQARGDDQGQVLHGCPLPPCSRIGLTACAAHARSVDDCILGCALASMIVTLYIRRVLPLAAPLEGPCFTVGPTSGRLVARPRYLVGATNPHPVPGRAPPCRRSGWSGPAPE